MQLWMLALAYCIIVNGISFAMMGIDKRKAIRHKWRIPEKSLFLAAILGGSIGANLGMQMFRHKTKHKQFIYGMPIILLVHILLTGCFLFM